MFCHIFLAQKGLFTLPRATMSCVTTWSQLEYVRIFSLDIHDVGFHLNEGISRHFNFPAVGFPCFHVNESMNRLGRKSFFLWKLFFYWRFSRYNITCWPWKITTCHTIPQYLYVMILLDVLYTSWGKHYLETDIILSWFTTHIVEHKHHAFLSI